MKTIRFTSEQIIGILKEAKKKAYQLKSIYANMV
jgi:hypothetical protein